jgi:hypothetical protein
MFHRSYDLSCVSDIQERTYIQNAINGVNAACSDTVDAWIYVERGPLLEDSHRTLDHNDYIPKTIFSAMVAENQNTFSLTLTTLQTISRDYEAWRLAREQENSLKEGSINFWNSWRSMRLMPYYRSMSGGGSVVSIGPILEEFLSLKDSRNEHSDECINIEKELMSYIGQNYQKQIDILTEIVSLANLPYCSELLDTLKKRVAHQVALEKRDELLLDDAISHLYCAVESRNPIALRAALNPTWYSTKFQNTELYKVATLLLNELT